ncbi:MAG TPA: hypothetical protein VI032_12390, partial [Burkholderiaceae bacterium]
MDGSPPHSLRSLPAEGAPAGSGAAEPSVPSSYAPGTWPTHLRALWHTLRAWPWADTWHTMRQRFAEDR